MRKRFLSALMMTLLLLPGCGGREARMEKAFESLRSAVTAATNITFRVSMTADRGDTAEQYVLGAAYDGQKTEIEILSPALLAGVKASAKRGETNIAYEGVILGAGPLDKEGTTPVSAIPVMLDALASAYVELLWRDGDFLAARLYVGEGSVLTVWLDKDTMAPQAAEIAADGRTVVTMLISDWQLS